MIVLKNHDGKENGSLALAAGLSFPGATCSTTRALALESTVFERLLVFVHSCP